MFEGALPFLVRRLRDHFWLDGYEMLARPCASAPIKSRRLDRLNYSLTCSLPGPRSLVTSQFHNFAVEWWSGGVVDMSAAANFESLLSWANHVLRVRV